MRFNDGKTRLGERGIVDRFENSSWSTKNWSSVVGVRMDTWSCSGELPSTNLRCAIEQRRVLLDNSSQHEFRRHGKYDTKTTSFDFRSVLDGGQKQ